MRDVIHVLAASVLRAALLAGLPALAADAPAAPTAPAAGDGKALFDYHCGKCHNPNETGTIMLGKRFGKEQALLQTRKELTAPFVKHVVRNGSLSMPRITRVEVPDADLDAIARYLTSSRRTP